MTASKRASASAAVARYRAPPRAALLTGRRASTPCRLARYPPERKASSLRGLRRQPDAPVIGKAARDVVFGFPSLLWSLGRDRDLWTPAPCTCCAIPSELPNRAGALPLSYRKARAVRAGLEPATSRVVEMPVHAIGTRRADSQAQRAEGVRTPWPLTHEHLGHSPTQRIGYAKKSSPDFLHDRVMS